MISKDFLHSNSILTVELGEKARVERHVEIEREKSAAIKNLLSDGDIQVNCDFQGPFHISVSIIQHSFVMVIKSEAKDRSHNVHFSLKPYRRIIKDYFLICESYQKAHVVNDHRKIEAIDMARRAIHNEGAGQLQDRLHHVMQMDFSTARNLFTLICVMHIGGVVPW